MFRALVTLRAAHVTPGAGSADFGSGRSVEILKGHGRLEHSSEMHIRAIFCGERRMNLTCPTASPIALNDCDPVFAETNGWLASMLDSHSVYDSEQSSDLKSMQAQ